MTNNVEIIKELEQLLEWAKEGKLLGFGYFGIKPQTIAMNWLGHASQELFIAGATLLQHDIVKLVAENNDDVPS